MSTGIAAAMTGFQARLQPLVNRPVYVDPSRTANTPCVLIELPRITPDGTLCGDLRYQHTVLVIGQPGSWPELQKLDELLAEVLDAFEGPLSVSWSLAEPVAYQPLVVDGTADPCISYRITLEELT